MNTLKSGIKNWKTTLIGVALSALTIIQTKGDVTLETVVFAVLMALAGLLSRDSDKSSEDSGAK